LERVTRIELALSAWESDRIVLPGGLTWQYECPLFTVVDPSSLSLMARQWPGDLETRVQLLAAMIFLKSGTVRAVSVA